MTKQFKLALMLSAAAVAVIVAVANSHDNRSTDQMLTAICSETYPTSDEILNCKLREAERLALRREADKTAAADAAVDREAR